MSKNRNNNERQPFFGSKLGDPGNFLADNRPHGTHYESGIGKSESGFFLVYESSSYERRLAKARNFLVLFDFVRISFGALEI